MSIDTKALREAHPCGRERTHSVTCETDRKHVVCALHLALDEVDRLRDALSYVEDLIVELPSGIDPDADEDDRSPEDMGAHIGGLVSRRVHAALKGEEANRG